MDVFIRLYVGVVFLPAGALEFLHSDRLGTGRFDKADIPARLLPARPLRPAGVTPRCSAVSPAGESSPESRTGVAQLCSSLFLLIVLILGAEAYSLYARLARTAFVAPAGTTARG
ncbi:hypothetical protein ADK86_27830 [Streptomyces sp. NRRL F-5755]|uniref:hypothetical protein n=1 Tax=Streptomyces sp. NRRL F-5755 TaxID=1519475 RepID=UPI0006B0313A|nr:hypothetical protein [Streptomyces sp. NRRL F-5755]KOT89951.1 hypothetical protein ADK86_27830 [Streptomyces sp. NRRL F-5755]